MATITQTKTIERDIESLSLYGNLALLFGDVTQAISARPSLSRVEIKLTEWRENGYRLTVNLFDAERGKEIVNV